MDESNKTVYATSGNKYKLAVPIEVTKGSEPNGSFYKKTVTVNGEEKQTVKGFLVSNEEQGAITAVTDEVAVIYEQLGDLSNIVTFYAIDGRKAVINVVNASTFVHTHQSIGQGGPAYGTYFRDRTNDEQ